MVSLSSVCVCSRLPSDRERERQRERRGGREIERKRERERCSRPEKETERRRKNKKKGTLSLSPYLSTKRWQPCILMITIQNTKGRGGRLKECAFVRRFESSGMW